MSEARCWRDERNADRKEKENGRVQSGGRVMLFLWDSSFRNRREMRQMAGQISHQENGWNQIIASRRKGSLCAFMAMHNPSSGSLSSLFFCFKKVIPWRSISSDRARDFYFFVVVIWVDE